MMIPFGNRDLILQKIKQNTNQSFGFYTQQFLDMLLYAKRNATPIYQTITRKSTNEKVLEKRNFPTLLGRIRTKRVENSGDLPVFTMTTEKPRSKSFYLSTGIVKYP